MKEQEKERVKLVRRYCMNITKKCPPHFYLYILISHLRLIYYWLDVSLIIYIIINSRLTHNFTN